jgi:hypothetical protein
MNNRKYGYYFQRVEYLKKHPGNANITDIEQLVEIALNFGEEDKDNG